MLSETVHIFKIKLLSETVQGQRLSGIEDCPGFGDCLGSKTVQGRRLSTVGDCPRALNEVVIGGFPKDLIYKNKKPFVLDKGSLGETPMTSFSHLAYACVRESVRTRDIG